MKILKKLINHKTNTFSVCILLEQDTDDLWNIYNLLNVGDLVYGTVRRKIAKDTLTGLVKNERKKFSLLLKITKFDFDGDADTIRLLGQNAKENNFIGLGAFQSMDLKAPMKITLIKRKFDSMHVKQLKEAAQQAQTGSIIVITMEEGLAHIF